MATFRFYQDVEVKTTRREYFEVKARNLKSAYKKLSEVTNLDECDDAEFIESEEIDDIFMDIEQFQNPDIIGIYDEDGNEQDEWEDLI